MPGDEVAADFMSHLRVEIRVERDRRVPHRFGRNGALREVVELIDHWPGEGHGYYRVRAEDAGVYILRHDERADRWEIHAFESRATAAHGVSRPGTGKAP